MPGETQFLRSYRRRAHFSKLVNEIADTIYDWVNPGAATCYAVPPLTSDNLTWLSDAQSRICTAWTNCDEAFRSHLSQEFAEAIDWLRMSLCSTTVEYTGDSPVEQTFGALYQLTLLADEKVEEEAIKAFGQWGALFFAHCADKLPDEVFQHDLHEPPPEQRHSSSIARTLRIDEAQFLVALPQKHPCKLGNTQRFHVLKILVDRAGSYVSHQDIAEATGGDALSDVYPMICRLKKFLRDREYGELADKIECTKGHYRIQLD